jgi:AraC-like DNA-binding protein
MTNSTLPVISSQILFLFSALGAVNGILLALYLFTRRTHRQANCMLGALLLAISVRTGKSTFYYFNPDISAEFIQIGLSACLLIGPLTYLYLHCHLADLADKAVGGRWHWHLLLPVFLIALGLVFPFSSYSAIWRHAILGIHLYWFSYLLLAGKALRQARTRSPLPLSVFFGSGLILAAYLSTPLTSYIVGALSFTFSIHLTILSFILRADAKPDSAKKVRYQNSKLGKEEAATLMAALNQVMGEQQLYLNPNLSLAQLAKKVGNLQTTVSQVINERLDQSFNHYVNAYRIEHAKHLLINETHLNMDLVAERSGFNSNSTFFAAFKKITSQTPANYRAACGSVSQPG